MCFSAEASVAVGAALLPAGGYCVRAAVRADRRYLLLAVTPWLFAVQQFCEAGVWVGLEHDRPALARGASLGFLFFAIGFWPFWAALAAVPLTPPGPLREAVTVLVAAGLTFGSLCYLPAVLHLSLWPAAEIVEHSLRYDFSRLPVTERVGDVVWGVLYLALVSVPPVLAADRRVRIFGALLAGSAGVAFVLFRYAFASVWCFFGAVLSVYLCYVMYRVLARGPRSSEVPYLSTQKAR